jgi:endoglycosylceramidase
VLGRLFALVAFLAGCCPATPVRPPWRLAARAPARRRPPDLRIAGRRFVDSDGRTVLLRGLNLGASAKVPPFLPLVDLARLDALPALGVDVVRVPFIWEAYEPERERYNEDYLAAFTVVVDAAWARGLFVIVDLHQDAFARVLAGGCGDGFPRWAIPPELAAAQPHNDARCAYWGIDTLTDVEVEHAFHAFYADRGGVRTRYLMLLQRVVAHFVDHAGVIGYDLMNEPGGSERAEVAPFYADAGAAVHAVDPDALLFVEPRAAAVSLAISAGDLPRPSLPNLVFAPHFYDAGLNLFLSWTGDRRLVQRAFALLEHRAAAWQVPLFLGEFGAPAPAVRSGDFVSAVWTELDRLLASGAQWGYSSAWTPLGKDGWNREDFSIVDGEGRLRRNFVLRPHPQRVAGPLDEIAVGKSGAGSLEVAWHNQSDAPSIFFVPRALFAGAPRVATSAGVSCRWDADDRHLLCQSRRRDRVWVRVAADR